MGMMSRAASLEAPSRDEELVRMARTGCMRATEQLLSKYRPLVESKARSYFLLGADHDDVVQEGMIGLYKAIRDFREDRFARFRAFADLCVTRQIITAVKTATRQKHLPLNAYVSLYRSPSLDMEGESALLDCLPDTHSYAPESYLFPHSDASGRLDAVRNTLSPLEMRVLDCYLQGKSYREMSTELQCQPKTVDNALQRVKRKISENLPQRTV
jgi:RNA polymerase sporulation-specific sigma factor